MEGNNSSLNFIKHYYYIYIDLDYKTKSLIKTIFRSNLDRIIIVLILGIFNTGINVVQIMIFKQYVTLFKDEDIENADLKQFLIYGCGFLVTKLINIFIFKFINEHQNYVGFKAGIELKNVIFDKLVHQVDIIRQKLVRF